MFLRTSRKLNFLLCFLPLDANFQKHFKVSLLFKIKNPALTKQVYNKHIHLP